MFKQAETPIAETNVAGLSPLDQIQRAETEIARRVAATRESARQVEIEAQEQAARMLHEAQEHGQREGQAEYEEVITQAQSEVAHLLTHAHQQAEALQQRSESYMTTAPHYAIAIVTGLNPETKTL